MSTEADSGSSGIVKLAVLAVGGQGGGVLTQWIADLATLEGYRVQMTSVAGVAQRTGATIYYIEMAPQGTREPVFALSPAPGDVDILIAAELMEAGRAVLRGFVTPDRTTLVASSHRILAVDEKIIPSNGIASSTVVLQQLQDAAHKLVCFDMQKIADDAGAFISASLFGALAGSGALPFSVDSYRQVMNPLARADATDIAAFDKAVKMALASPSLITNGVDAADDTNIENTSTDTTHFATTPVGPDVLLQQWHKLCARVEALPAPAQAMARVGLKHCVDYQDVQYGEEYLQRLEAILQQDAADHQYELTTTAAKYLANAMCYDDIVRVADLKTRRQRLQRVATEHSSGEQRDINSDVFHLTEYLHPRAAEVCATLPSGLGARIANHPRWFGYLDKLVNKGRRIRTDSVSGFTTLWLVAGLKRWRRKMLRHQQEQARIHSWLQQVDAAANENYALAIELLRCQRLIKGYSDTHARGQSKYHRIMAASVTLAGQSDAADKVRRWLDAALQDDTDTTLETRLQGDGV